MFKNFIVLAYRHFVRSPLTSFIELFGMTAGLTVFLLVLLWVTNETSYDSFNKNADRIYRFESINSEGKIGVTHSTRLAPLLQEYVPEIEKTVRFRSIGNGRSYVSRANDKGVKSEYDAGRMIYTDSTFFDTFTFEFVAGDPKTALVEKNTTVITESLAQTIFGNRNAIGQSLVAGKTFVVTGVIKDVPNFHIPFKMLRSFVSLVDHQAYVNLGGINSWETMTHSNYLLVTPNHRLSELEEKIENTIWEHLPEKYKKNISRSDIKPQLRPITDIYLNDSDVKDTFLAKHGDRKKIVAYSTIAFITLLLASINFINLNNAKYFERVKEVGIKKVCGASRMEVFVQFQGEVALLCLVSLILAIIFTHSILPLFNEMVDTKLSINQLFHPYSCLSMSIGLLLISLTSGGFSAFYASSFRPVLAIKGVAKNSGKNFNFKRINLVIQFSITIMLLTGAITAYRQVNFMKNVDLGFGQDEAHRIAIANLGKLSPEKVSAIRSILLSNPKVQNLTHAGLVSIPGENRSTDWTLRSLTFDGINHSLSFVAVDEDYSETLGLEILEGRFFEKGRAGDHWTDSIKTINIVLNETAVKNIGLENPIGVSAKVDKLTFRIIGVIKDFHLNSVNHPIAPMVLIPARSKYQFIAKLSSNDVASTIEFVRTTCNRITGRTPRITFLDDKYQRQYIGEENFASLIGYFTILTILIACLGLLGIATQAIKLRIKEIGIRKVMGASSIQVLKLLTTPFIKIVAISAVLSVPVGFLAIQAWLDNYPYRTDLPWWVFGVAITLTVAVAAFTIIWQSWRASSMNPARLIRYE
ncbi:MAG: ABC transporter permease [Cyclobacteriaceae bacterium]